ncbi:protein of unknown function (DUF4149) domain containing protein [Elaphomyces granulatus]|jgi:hypothetical protein
MLNLASFHILSYGALFGSQLYQTFVGGLLAYRALPRPQFVVLQSVIFPVYFTLQTTLPVVSVLTFPGRTTASDVGPSSIIGLVADENRLSTLLPLITVFVAGLTNLLFLSPLTAKTIQERKRQETIDGKKSYDDPPHSNKMIQLNKKFRKLHGYSSIVNLAALVATGYYGLVLGGRLR